ncbi:MAG: 2Fe-2S iron-sulfur cluster binding domain-containing protein [Spirochaetaceae bacterium]|jgi:carbon-monoxide dehydrogenase small subunit|nr:2Fe-2S iron-sulfur cluster binding domain-containing protein [Spirochaetaceae bacterium]
MKITFTLNGKEVSAESTPDTRMVHLLREQFGLLGTKEGCLQGKCGYCLILLNGNPAPACMLPAFSAFHGNIITIEGLRGTPEFTDIEKGFIEAEVNPCGFCASAKMITAYKLLQENPAPSEPQIRKAMSAVLCRCTAGSFLVQGVQAAAFHRRQRSHGSQR